MLRMKDVVICVKAERFGVKWSMSNVRVNTVAEVAEDVMRG